MELLKQTFDVEEIVFDKSEFSEIEIDANVVCGVFCFRGLKEDICQISKEIKKHAITKEEVRVEKYVEGIYEVVSWKNEPISFYQNIMKRYPYVKVIGLCANTAIYEIYSESGYGYFTGMKRIGWTVRHHEDPWWLREKPGQDYIAEIWEMEDCSRYYQNEQARTFRSVFRGEWTIVDYVIQKDGVYYSLQQKKSMSNRRNECAANKSITLTECKKQWRVKKEEGSYRLLKYLGNSEQVFIPGVINHCPVKVGRDLFIKDWRYINETVKSIVVGEGVQLIEDAAFYNCARVEYIFIPNTLKSIGSSAFFGCYMLRHDIIISNTLFCVAPTIHRRRYRVKENVSEIAHSAFTLGFNIQEIDFNSNIRKMGDLPSGMKTFIMPDSVEEISPNFCSVMTELEKIVLSSRLKEIPEGAFDFCPKLVEVILPKSVRKIGDFAFRNTVCKFSKEKLSDADEIVIPPTVEEIGGYESFVEAEKIAVFDTLKKWRFRHCRIEVIDQKNYIIEVYSARDYQLKYKLWITHVGEDESLREELCHIWKSGAEIDFERYDRLISQYKIFENKMMYAIMRLRYQYKLENAHKEKLTGFYLRNRGRARFAFREQKNQEAMKIISELDDILGYNSGDVFNGKVR